MSIDSILSDDENFFNIYEKYPPVRDIVKNAQNRYGADWVENARGEAKEYIQQSGLEKEIVKLYSNQKQRGIETKAQTATTGMFNSFFEGIGKLFSNPVAVTATAVILLSIGYIALPPAY